MNNYALIVNKYARARAEGKERKERSKESKEYIYKSKEEKRRKVSAEAVIMRTAEAFGNADMVC